VGLSRPVMGLLCVIFYFTVQRTFTTITVLNFAGMSAYKISDTFTINGDFFHPPHKFIIFRKVKIFCLVTSQPCKKSKPGYPDRYFPQEKSKTYLPTARFCQHITQCRVGRDSCRYSDSLQVGGSGDRTPLGGTRVSAPVETGPGAQPASYIMGTGSLSHG